MSNRIDLKQFEDLQHSWRTRSGIYDELFSEWIEGRKEEIMAELKRCYRVIEDIESMIPDNHEEIDPVLSDILSECHRLLGM